MPPPRRQNPATPTRRPRVAGRSPAAAPAQPLAAQPPAEKPFVEEPAKESFGSRFLGRKATVDTSSAEVPPIEEVLTETEPQPETKVDLAKSKTEAAESVPTGDDAIAAEPTRKKAPAPYKLAKPRIEPAASHTGPDPTSGPHRRKVSRTTKVLAVLAVIFAVAAIVSYLQPGTPDTSNTAWVDDEATNEVTSSTVTALQTVFSYKADTIDQDQDAARGFLGGDRLDEYNKTAAQTKAGVLQTMTTASATVTDIGVTTLQGDRAELVASMEIAANQDGADQGTVQTPVVVTMTRVDGKWIITQIDNR